MVIGESHWNILFVDDDEDDYILTRGILSNIEKRTICLEWAQNYQEAIQKLSSDDWDVVLVDYDLGSENGLQLIRDATEIGAKAPFIMVTGRGRYDLDVEAMRAGAFDYVTKTELSPPLLERVIRYAKERKRIEELLEQRVRERTEALQTALEELQVVEEELRTKLDESVRVQENQAARYAWYQELFEFAPSAYLVTDAMGVILESNWASATLFNKDKKYLVGKPLVVFIAEEDRTTFRSLLNRLSEHPGNQEWDLHMQFPQRETDEVHILVSPVVGMDGKTITIRWLLVQKEPV